MKVQGVNGNPLPDAPENKFALAVAYTWHFDPGDLLGSVSFAYRDTQNGTLFNRFYDNAPSWTDLDFRLTWKAPHDKYEITGFVKNATDSLQYTVAAGGAVLGGSATSIGPNPVNSYNLNRQEPTASRCATGSSSRYPQGYLRGARFRQGARLLRSNRQAPLTKNKWRVRRLSYEAP